MLYLLFMKGNAQKFIDTFERLASTKSYNI